MQQLTTQKCYWKNGELVDFNQAQVSVFDHGLLYGDGCFEGLRFYNQRPFMLARHLERLGRSLHCLSIDIAYNAAELEQAVQACIDNYPLDSGYLRILVSRGVGDMGLNPQNCTQANVFIIPAELNMTSAARRAEGMRLISSSIKRVTGTGLDTRVKSLNYLHSVLARAEANAAGADEAILLNQYGNVAEASAANIFIVKDDELKTPQLSDGALEGITRGLIFELAAAAQLPARAQTLSPYDLYTADECFICGSGAGLLPVLSIDMHKLKVCRGEIFQRLEQGMQSLINKVSGVDYAN